MSNCSNSANSQLKAIQARLDRIDDDLIAHYAGVSQLVAGLTANPLTASAAAKSLTTYNFSAVGQKLLKNLLGLIPGYDQFKALQHLDSAALIGNMGDAMAGTALKVVEQAAAEATQAIEQQAAALAAQAAAAAALVQAIKNSVSDAERKALELAKGAADQAADAAAAEVARHTQIGSAVNQFIATLTDIASCRTRSSIVT